ncbi:MAG: 2-oxo-4-hydroxy-4-carboxy-5-ureidoimidazoline decarboxylase [Cyanobacteria bacterium P01_A01_bin.123]
MTYLLADLNRMAQVDFTAALEAVFEDTPAIAAATWHHRPFNSLDHLHGTMVACVNALSPAEQLTLICAHPDLGSRVAMADASVQEQAGVGLNQLSAERYDQFQQLNQAYRIKFGFPFIIAVKHHTPDTILSTFAIRLQNSESAERSQALSEIFQIARFRLEAWIEES